MVFIYSSLACAVILQFATLIYASPYVEMPPKTPDVSIQVAEIRNCNAKQTSTLRTALLDAASLAQVAIDRAAEKGFADDYGSVELQVCCQSSS